MRLARNFNPEWGYVAPAPSFIRAVRIALVSGVVGATAGAAVVFSLVERPAADVSVASRTLIQSAAVGSVPAPAAPPAPVSISTPRATANANTSSADANERSKSAAISYPVSAAAALAESPTMSDAPPVQSAVQAANVTTTSLDKASAQRKPAKRAHVTPRYDPPRYDQALRGPLALLPLNGARPQSGDYYGQRGEY